MEIKIGTNERKLKNGKNKDKIVVRLCLDESFDCKKFEKFIARHKIVKGNYMVWISLATEQYSDGVLVPKHVLNILKRLDCDLNFSFTKI